MKYEFDVIGFSTYIWNKNYVLSLAKKVKEKKKATVILGGPEVSYNAGEILSDYDFVGESIFVPNAFVEGESALVEFTNYPNGVYYSYRPPERVPHPNAVSRRERDQFLVAKLSMPSRSSFLFCMLGLFPF